MGGWSKVVDRERCRVFRQGVGGGAELPSRVGCGRGVLGREVAVLLTGGFCGKGVVERSGCGSKVVAQRKVSILSTWGELSC